MLPKDEENFLFIKFFSKSLSNVSSDPGHRWSIFGGEKGRHKKKIPSRCAVSSNISARFSKSASGSNFNAFSPINENANSFHSTSPVPSTSTGSNVRLISASPPGLFKNFQLLLFGLDCLGDHLPQQPKKNGNQ